MCRQPVNPSIAPVVVSYGAVYSPCESTPGKQESESSVSDVLHCLQPLAGDIRSCVALSFTHLKVEKVFVSFCDSEMLCTVGKNSCLLEAPSREETSIT